MVNIYRRPVYAKRTTGKKRTKTVTTVSYPRRSVRYPFGSMTRRISGTQPVPAQQVVKMKYSTFVEIDSDSGAAAKYFFRANSIYDPDYTGVGHKPMPYDLWDTLYNHYTVIDSKLKCKIWSEDSGTNYMSMVGIYLSDDATVATLDPHTLQEQSRTKTKLLRHRPDGSNSIVSLSKSFNASKWFGVTSSALSARDDVGALFGNNPNDGAFFCIFVCPPDQATDVPECKALITMEFTVMLREPKELATN